jgi:alanine racemase
MRTRDPGPKYLTEAVIHLDRLTHNLRLLQAQVGERPMWPAIKANGYGHGTEIVARHLVGLGYHTLCVAHAPEAVALIEAGVGATYLVLSATLPEHAEAIVAYDLEPAVCTREMVATLAEAAAKAGKVVPLHLVVDTGMGRIGIRPDEVPGFVEFAHGQPALRLRGLMSHFPRADEADKAYSLAQIEDFRGVVEATGDAGFEVRHLANSAGILDLPTSYFDAVRPGIAVYGLRPSPEIASSLANDLQPVLEWRTRITFLKEVPVGTGLSYGHGPQPRALQPAPGPGGRRQLRPGGAHHHGPELGRRDAAPRPGGARRRGGADWPPGRGRGHRRRDGRDPRHHQLRDRHRHSPPRPPPRRRRMKGIMVSPSVQLPPGIDGCRGGFQTRPYGLDEAK